MTDAEAMSLEPGDTRVPQMCDDFDIACERIEAAQRQGHLFLPDRQGDVYDQVTIDYESLPYPRQRGPRAV